MINTDWMNVFNHKMSSLFSSPWVIIIVIVFVIILNGSLWMNVINNVWSFEQRSMCELRLCPAEGAVVCSHKHTRAHRGRRVFLRLMCRSETSTQRRSCCSSLTHSLAHQCVQDDVSAVCLQDLFSAALRSDFNLSLKLRVLIPRVCMCVCW